MTHVNLSLHTGTPGRRVSLFAAAAAPVRRGSRVYWLTNSATASAQLYWENDNNNFNAAEQKTADISIPVAVTVFPGDIYRAPRSWTERSYRNLIYFNDVDKGGHFAAWEQPNLFAAELRAAFTSLR